MKAASIPNLTVEEYLKHELITGMKYEFHAGQIYALAGGSLQHGLLCGNAYAEIRKGLEANGSDCKPLNSEVKLHIAAKNSFVYPDVMAIFGDLEVADQDENSVTNPVLIVEVLSKSTAEYDRGDKFFLYRQLPSLVEYCLIEQDKAVVEVFYKKPGNDLWRINRYEGLEQVIHFRSIDIQVSLADLYFDIQL